MSMSKAIGPYRLESILGRGGMSEVHIAFDQRLERRVAIKRLRADWTQSECAASRLQREAKAVAALAHPAIVQIFDVVEDADDTWIVLELVDGQSLASRLRQSLLNVVEALEVGVGVAEGLAFAHAKGILHRDLKTENVMLANNGEIKILDFGLAKNLLVAESTLTADGVVLGTLRAMSPEQAMGLELDFRSDLFSLGVLLYESLIGRSPFASESATTTITKICSYQQPPLRLCRQDVPIELSRLVDSLLEKDRKHRPSSDETRDRLRAMRQNQAAPTTRSVNVQPLSNEAAHSTAADRNATTLFGSHAGADGPDGQRDVNDDCPLP